MHGLERLFNQTFTIDNTMADSINALSFDQPFLKDSDFNVYNKEDESTVLTGEIGDLGLVPWVLVSTFLR